MYKETILPLQEHGIKKPTTVLIERFLKISRMIEFYSRCIPKDPTFCCSKLMGHKIRHAMAHRDSYYKLAGFVEMYDT